MSASVASADDREPIATPDALEADAGWRPAGRVALITIIVTAIGFIDYWSGVELRVYPLYFLPVGYAAWHFGRAGSLVAAVGGTTAWVLSNELSGLRYSAMHVWVVNTGVQFVALAVVGVLIATVRRAEVRQRNLGGVDPVTALLNRRGFVEAGSRLLARHRRASGPITAAYVDLDNFKLVNDSLGHHAGDELLRQVGKIIRLAVRPGDLAARVGGDEFAILLPDVGEAEAAVVLERIRRSLADAFALSRYPVSGSIGAAIFDRPPADLEAMIRRADAAMYAAKTGGRNRIELVKVAPA